MIGTHPASAVAGTARTVARGVAGTVIAR